MIIEFFLIIVWLSTLSLVICINKKQGEVMATLDEVKQAIADEKAEVLQKLTDLNQEIQDLKDQVASGTPVTEADLDDLKTSINDIFVA